MSEHPTFESYDGYWQIQVDSIGPEPVLVTIDGSNSHGDDTYFHCVFVTPQTFGDSRVQAFGYDEVPASMLTRPDSDTVFAAEEAAYAELEAASDALVSAQEAVSQATAHLAAMQELSQSTKEVAV